MDITGYVAAFNSAVRKGDWPSLAPWFTEDAVLEFAGPAVGPFDGRRAILAAYETSPPDDEIELSGSVESAGDGTVVPYRWQTTGATGTMSFTERDGAISRLVIRFD